MALLPEPCKARMTGFIVVILFVSEKMVFVVVTSVLLLSDQYFLFLDLVLLLFVALVEEEFP